MNIIQINKFKIYLKFKQQGLTIGSILLFFLFSSDIIKAQEKIYIVKDTNFSFSIEIGAGALNCFGSNEAESTIGFASSARIIWKPNRKLNIGIETAYLPLLKQTKENISSEYGTTNFTGNLYAIPLILIFDMELFSIDFFAGAGIANIHSNIEAFSVQSEADYLFGSFLFGAGYTYKLTDRFGIGAEAKFYSFTKSRLTAITGNIKICYDFLRW